MYVNTEHYALVIRLSYIHELKIIQRCDNDILVSVAVCIIVNYRSFIGSWCSLSQNIIELVFRKRS